MAENRYSIQEFKIQPLSGDIDTLDIRGGVISLEYYEDILSPSITATVLFSSSEVKKDDGDSDVEIFGGEGVIFDIGHGFISIRRIGLHG